MLTLFAALISIAIYVTIRLTPQLLFKKWVAKKAEKFAEENNLYFCRNYTWNTTSPKSFTSEGNYAIKCFNETFGLKFINILPGNYDGNLALTVNWEMDVVFDLFYKNPFKFKSLIDSEFEKAKNLLVAYRYIISELGTEATENFVSDIYNITGIAKMEYFDEKEIKNKNIFKDMNDVMNGDFNLKKFDVYYNPNI